MSEQMAFEPGKYLTKVSGSDYLEVKWRLVWLRDVHPDAALETEMVSHGGQFAVFRAKVSIPGGGSATGWGSEDADDFRDYIEKAETKAVGRALAALGFGTQFCPDFDFGAAAGRVVDTPIDFASTKGRRVAGAAAAGDRHVANLNQPATDRQLKFIQAIAREAGLDDATLNGEVSDLFGHPLSDLSRRDASSFIERLQARRASERAAS